MEAELFLLLLNDSRNILLRVGLVAWWLLGRALPQVAQMDRFLQTMQLSSRLILDALYCAEIGSTGGARISRSDPYLHEHCSGLFPSITPDRHFRR